jgi:hypothetical protein
VYLVNKKRWIQLSVNAYQLSVLRF